MQVIDVEHLVRKYGDFVAVDDVSFAVAEGEFFGFLGPNGAGKTTTINVLCTLLRPSAGVARVNGYDVATKPNLVRRSIGMVFQDPTLDDRLTAYENLEFHARVYNVPRADWQERSEQLLRVLELWERRHDLVRTFSGGMRRRLEVARGLLHRPAVLFLGEPTLGLDPQTREHIWHYLTDLRSREGTTLFLTTHYMEETEGCDRIAIIDHGKIVALDTPDWLKAMVGGDVITIQTPDGPTAIARLRARFGLVSAQVDRSVRVEVQQGEQLVPRLVAHLAVPTEPADGQAVALRPVGVPIDGFVGDVQPPAVGQAR